LRGASKEDGTQNSILKKSEKGVTLEEESGFGPWLKYTSWIGKKLQRIIKGVGQKI